MIIYFDRTLIKITAESKQSWTKMLQPTVLKMNSTHKRAIGATPFRIMFGRESRCTNLLELLQIQPQVFEDEENIHDDSMDCPDEHERNARIDDECLDFDEKRLERWESARNCIFREQVKQKQTFDDKVILKRYIYSSYSYHVMNSIVYSNTYNVANVTYILPV